MKRKILIAGGSTSFSGPWINLEEGIWLVEPPLSGKVFLRFSDGEEFYLQETAYIPGPARFHCFVEDDEGFPVHLDAKKAE